MFKRFYATVKGITYLCVVKLYRIVQCLRTFFSIFQFESRGFSNELKVSNTIVVCSHRSPGLRIGCPIMNAQILCVRDTTIFVISSKFSENSIYRII